MSFGRVGDGSVVPDFAALSCIRDRHVSGRRIWYLEPAKNQRDLDRFLDYYNLERSHQGYRLMGRTPAQALREALNIDSLPPPHPPPNNNTSEKEETTTAA